jgi:UDP-2,3-diacylglucosamine hydrolase
VAAYFASDVHLRLDCPARSRRFARFVGALEPEQDTLTIVGDLCDFWFEARQCDSDAANACAGLRALTEFRRQGGAVTILVGNHDNWLGPYYTNLGLDFRDEPLELAVHGLRVHLVHGHRLALRRGWKSWMESRIFLRMFQALPGFLAALLDRLLEWSKSERNQLRAERRYYCVFRRYAAQRRDADLVLIGHVHTPLDDNTSNPRLIVPGGWHARASYVKIDDTGASLIIETDQALISH